MQIKEFDVKDLLKRLSFKYEISERYILNNAVYLLWMLSCGLVHKVDAEGILLSDDVAFQGFNKFID